MRAIKIPAPNFDLAMTLNSGQVFHWEKCGDGFVGAIGKRAVCVEQRGAILKVREGRMPSPAGETPTLPEILVHYFALDHPLAEICASFRRDRAMDEARAFCRGLRIIRQPKWECLATFICSSMKQVAHIRQISLALRRRFGRKRSSVNDVYDFPSAKKLARLAEKELRACGLGYRAENLRQTAKIVASRPRVLEKWDALADDELRARLCELPGVGVKIANCVMLFAYERTAAFPIDVWIERVLREKYFPRRRKVTAKRLREFAASYFGAHGGYAQQYLFHHARMERKRPAVKNRKGNAVGSS